MDGIRLDFALVQKRLCTSRQRAKESIENGLVSVNGKVIRKASFIVKEEDVIQSEYEEHYVSRGGHKIEAILEKEFVDQKIVMDVGASTGGFTQCLLENGARKVYAVDVGHGQLHESLRQNHCVCNLEGTDIRDRDALSCIQNGEIEFCSIDVSFISLQYVIPSIVDLLSDYAFVGCLIKPQFEVGKEYIGKHGIVKDKNAHYSCLKNVLENFNKNGLYVDKLIFSPITGGDGNIEYLALAKKQLKQGKQSCIDIYSIVDDAFQNFKKKKGD